MSSTEIIEALDRPVPVPEKVLWYLEEEITCYDCEEWSAPIGRAIIARLRREGTADGPGVREPV